MIQKINFKQVHGNITVWLRIECKTVEREHLSIHIKLTNITLAFAISTFSMDFLENENQV